MEESERSFAKIEESDLERLAQLSREDRDEFFSRHRRWQHLYASRLLCVTLCQSAAVHYVDGRYGAKDFDVWTFYAEHPDEAFPGDAWAEKTTALQSSERIPDDAGYVRRRVDLLARSIHAVLQTAFRESSRAVLVLQSERYVRIHETGSEPNTTSVARASRLAYVTTIL